MPVYEYECQACHHRFERRQGFHDEPIKVCPECGGTTRKLLSRPGIVFKGSGWYINDSRPTPPSEVPSSGASSTGSTPASPTPSTSPSTGGSEAKSETKSEAKKD